MENKTSANARRSFNPTNKAKEEEFSNRQGCI
jgi:hypothetical protein